VQLNKTFTIKRTRLCYDEIRALDIASDLRPKQVLDFNYIVISGSFCFCSAASSIGCNRQRRSRDHCDQSFL